MDSHLDLIIDVIGFGGCLVSEYVHVSPSIIAKRLEKGWREIGAAFLIPMP